MKLKDYRNRKGNSILLDSYLIGDDIKYAAKQLNVYLDDIHISKKEIGTCFYKYYVKEIPATLIADKMEISASVVLDRKEKERKLFIRLLYVKLWNKTHNKRLVDHLNNTVEGICDIVIGIKYHKFYDKLINRLPKSYEQMNHVMDIMIESAGISIDDEYTYFKNHNHKDFYFNIMSNHDYGVYHPDYHIMNIDKVGYKTVALLCYVMYEYFKKCKPEYTHYYSKRSTRQYNGFIGLKEKRAINEVEDFIVNQVYR